MKPSTEEKYFISACLARIEDLLGWGDSAHWSNDDLETLSELISRETGVRLSVTTLKRVWGKVKYEHQPTVTTLNTLAGFSGFDSWRAFVQQHNKVPADERSYILATMPREREGVVNSRLSSLSRTWKALVVSLPAVAFLSFYFSTQNKKQPAVDPSRFNFSLNKVMTSGVPNSVIFTYDAAAAPSDSVFIVQTWDRARETTVSRQGHHHSAIYYYPGFFRTKLIVDQTVVKTKDLQINTDGWLAMADHEPEPIYFKKADYMKGSLVDVGQAMLNKYQLLSLPETPRIRLFNQRDLGNLMNDDFGFETTLKSELANGNNACQYAEVLIQCKDDIIIIPLSARSCVGELQLYAAGADVSSKSADLSGFGCDLSQWTKLKVECHNRQMRFFLNDRLVYSLTIPHKPAGIVGLQYRFKGPCAVKNTRFWNKEGEVPL